MHGTEKGIYVVMDTPGHWRLQKHEEVGVRELYVTQAIDQQGQN